MAATHFSVIEIVLQNFVESGSCCAGYVRLLIANIVQLSASDYSGNYLTD